MATQIESIKTLRESTGSGVMECKRALEEAGGDLERAAGLLRQRGLARAEAKQERETAEGTVCCYVHFGDKLAAMLELGCETDFVASNVLFRELAAEVAMQVAALAPEYIASEDVPAEVQEKQLKSYREEALAQGKREDVAERIAQGKLGKFYEQVCLLEQPSIRDENVPIKEVIAERAGRLGENIRVKRFARFRVGERTQVADAS